MVNAKVFYTLRDQLNSASVILNQSGAVVTNGNQYDTPYGSNRGGMPFSAVTTQRFTGQYHNCNPSQKQRAPRYMIWALQWLKAK